jgi:hypothetical protein
VYYTNYGGTAGALLTLIPEPSALVMGVLAWMGLAGLLRRRATGS